MTNRDAASRLLFVAMRSARVRDVLSTPYRAVRIAALWGPLIWMVMSLVVIPIFTQRPPNITTRWWIQLLGHIPFVAIPMVWSISRSTPNRRSPS